MNLMTASSLNAVFIVTLNFFLYIPIPTLARILSRRRTVFSTNLQEYALTCIKTATTSSLFDGNNSLPDTPAATIFQ